MDESKLNYTEMIKRSTLLARFRYLELKGVVGVETFGFDRHLNQRFYKSHEWKTTRDWVIIRDNGCDLGVPGYAIHDRILVHHMNPLRIEDILERNMDRLFNPEHLVCVSTQTHNAIHFSDENQLPRDFVERRPGDTQLW